MDFSDREIKLLCEAVENARDTCWLHNDDKAAEGLGLLIRFRDAEQRRANKRYRELSRKPC